MRELQHVALTGPPRSMITQKPTGVILAGGQSRRMREAFAGDQSDKTLLDLAGHPMLAHVVARLAPQIGQLVINTNSDPERFASFGLPVIADSVGEFAGPLAGILAGLEWSATHTPHATHILTAPGDTPFLPTDLVARLRDGLSSSGAAIALARSADGLHPVIGLWPVELASDLRAALQSGTRKVQDWTNRNRVVSVDFPPLSANRRQIDPFFNANTPADLALARTFLEE